jgi:hypothetical protein
VLVLQHKERSRKIKRTCVEAGSSGPLLHAELVKDKRVQNRAEVILVDVIEALFAMEVVCLNQYDNIFCISVLRNHFDHSLYDFDLYQTALLLRDRELLLKGYDELIQVYSDSYWVQVLGVQLLGLLDNFFH